MLETLSKVHVTNSLIFRPQVNGSFKSLGLKRTMWQVSFAQWHYHWQWGLTESWLLLIENFYQYPAGRHEILTAMQSLEVSTETTILINWKQRLIKRFDIVESGLLHHRVVHWRTQAFRTKTMYSGSKTLPLGKIWR